MPMLALRGHHLFNESRYVAERYRIRAFLMRISR